jgi:hypothetical protein
MISVGIQPTRSNRSALALKADAYPLAVDDYRNPALATGDGQHVRQSLWRIDHADIFNQLAPFLIGLTGRCGMGS